MNAMNSLTDKEFVYVLRWDDDEDNDHSSTIGAYKSLMSAINSTGINMDPNLMKATNPNGELLGFWVFSVDEETDEFGHKGSWVIERIEMM